MPFTIVPGSAYGNLSATLSQPVRTNWWELVAMGGGAGFCALLMLIKLNFPSLPLHPVALPVASGGSIEGTAAAVFIAWAVKAAVLGWGGRGACRLSLQFGLGLIVGDATLSSVLAIVRQALNLP